MILKRGFKAPFFSVDCGFYSIISSLTKLNSRSLKKLLKNNRQTDNIPSTINVVLKEASASVLSEDVVSLAMLYINKFLSSIKTPMLIPKLILNCNIVQTKLVA